MFWPSKCGETDEVCLLISYRCCLTTSILMQTIQFVDSDSDVPLCPVCKHHCSANEVILYAVLFFCYLMLSCQDDSDFPSEISDGNDISIDILWVSSNHLNLRQQSLHVYCIALSAMYEYKLNTLLHNASPNEDPNFTCPILIKHA